MADHKIGLRPRSLSDVTLHLHSAQSPGELWSMMGDSVMLVAYSIPALKVIVPPSRARAWDTNSDVVDAARQLLLKLSMRLKEIQRWR